MQNGKQVLICIAVNLEFVEQSVTKLGTMVRLVGLHIIGFGMKANHCCKIWKMTDVIVLCNILGKTDMTLWFVAEPWIRVFKLRVVVFIEK